MKERNVEVVITSYNHMVEALLGIEQTSINRLNMWEQELLSDEVSHESEAFMESPSYGDGGMAAAVRIATKRGSVEENGNRENRNK